MYASIFFLAAFAPAMAQELKGNGQAVDAAGSNGPSGIAGQLSGTEPSAAPVGGGLKVQETYGAWMVTCLPRESKRICAVRQFQTDRQTGKPVLMVELRATEARSAKGGIMLPNSLRHDAGVRLVLDGKVAGQALPIRDCTQRGCAVTVTFAGAAFEKLLAGKSLQLLAVGRDGKPQVFKIDLDGFAKAAERGIQLEKQ